MLGCKTCHVKGHNIASCARWSKSSNRLNIFIDKVKHFECAVLVLGAGPLSLGSCHLEGAPW